MCKPCYSTFLAGLQSRVEYCDRCYARALMQQIPCHWAGRSDWVAAWSLLPAAGLNHNSQEERQKIDLALS